MGAYARRELPRIKPSKIAPLGAILRGGALGLPPLGGKPKATFIRNYPFRGNSVRAVVLLVLSP